MTSAPFHGDLVTGDLPAIAGTCKGPATVIGPGRDVKSELSSFQVRGHVIAVTTVGIFLPRLHHWIMGVPRKMMAFKIARTAMRGVTNGHTTHAKEEGYNGRDIDVLWPIAGLHTPTAGHTAAVITLLLGYAPVILMGLPADDSGHFYPDAPINPDGLEQLDYGERRGKYQDAWLWLRDNFFEGRVKSVSGNTREWLGSP